MRIHSVAPSNRHPFSIPGADIPQVCLEPADLRILIVNEDMRSATSLKRTLCELGCHTTLTPVPQSGR